MRVFSFARNVSSAAALLALAALAGSVMPVAAQQPSPTVSAEPVTSAEPARLSIVATYPSIVVDPGTEARFSLVVTGPGEERVDLAVDGLPEDFEAVFRGGNTTVRSVSTGGEEPPSLELRVSVPEAAPPASHPFVVTGTAPSGTVELPLELAIADLSGGTVSLTTEFRALRGDAEATFSFDLDLANDTAQDIDFTVTGEGPAGWEVEVRPVGKDLAATTPVTAGSKEDLRVSVTPARRAEAGVHPILVRASGGGHEVEVALSVEITGSYGMAVTTGDGRLNTTATAGSAARFEVMILNEGTAPLIDVTLDSRSPIGWEVIFEPEAIEMVEPGGSAVVTAVITPADNAVAGDYVVTLMADNDEVDDRIEVRVTVETSTLWGLGALAVIVVVLLGLGLVFRRYGRR